MKREELTTLGIEGEALEQVMALYGRDVEKHKAAAKQWEEKHAADTAALQTQLAQQAYNAGVEKAVQGVQFTSHSAQQAFCTALQGAALPLENGTLTGFEPFLQAYKEKDAAAFAAQNAGKAPVFVKPAAKEEAPAASAALRAAFGLH